MTERISVWNDTSYVNSVKPKSISTLVSITYEIVIPTELIVGFTFQLCNLALSCPDSELIGQNWSSRPNIIYYVAMAVCPLVALYCPLRHLNFGSRKNLWVVIAAYTSVAIVLIPTTMMKEVQKVTDNNGSVFYFTVDNTQAWVRTSRYIVAAIFEIVIILLVLIIYALILVKYRHIVRSNVTQVHQNFKPVDVYLQAIIARRRSSAWLGLRLF
ncbi:hypothetical protein TSPI_10293 [Trichinella spiralis]|uniref:Serpentine receptor class gamma n=1 Tax=Trichinella spiralis TaxID=6334 RepID=A0ABR3KM91_TRISP